ncbi:fatty acid desaturase [Xylophilus rhododendri]|uniref:Fatty acid desaturase n=1 Tax=Xylophilus rhododendri TaxID=2697032 RepID=A0A857J4R1_9BURK|nr:fatty acid desaturase [Xylophilus rhododendri]QHI98950.1 fatty acid desaturase [Xylophilus rhododendri]
MEKPVSIRLKGAELLPLSVRSDRPGLLRAAGHLGAIVLGGVALWHTRGSWWAVPLTVLQGWFIAFLFNVLHETAHQTPFKTRALNYAMGHLAGLAILMPYEYYRCFHWDHHRYTQDPARDPELAVPPPPTGPALAWYWSGIPTWINRVRMLWAHGVRGVVRERWVAEGKRALIVREARFYLLAYAVLIAASVAAQSLALLWLWLLPVAVGQWLLRPYLLAEHTGCAYSPDMLENTRTTYTNAVVRFFAWNMPFHAEHHAYPAVPFHALPRLNALLAQHIRNTEAGYPASTAAVLRFLASEEHAAGNGTKAVS